jgi:hypothetical protein
VQHKPLWLLLILMLCSACAAPVTTESSFIKFNIIEHGQTSGLTFQRYFLIQSQNEFQDLWTIHSQPTGKAMPKIDFENDMVLAVFHGQTQTGGYDIYIHDIEETETELIVTVYFVEPAANSMRTMMIAQPHMLVTLPKNAKPVRFVNVRK